LNDNLEHITSERGSKKDTLEDFHGQKWFSTMKTELDELGVEDVEDLEYITEEEIKMLAAKLMTVQA